jgi:hypothetical protein
MIHGQQNIKLIVHVLRSSEKYLRLGIIVLSASAVDYTSCTQPRVAVAQAYPVLPRPVPSRI